MNYTDGLIEIGSGKDFVGTSIARAATVGCLDGVARQA
jgi:hypothetical protein